MNIAWHDILNLPDKCRVDKRLTKVFFERNFDLSTGEKKLLGYAIAGMTIIGSIQPSTANVNVQVNEDRTFEEVLVIHVELNDVQLHKSGLQAAELIQKYLPYHILLIVEDAHEYLVNGVLKRVNQNDKKRRVLEQEFITKPLSRLYKNDASARLWEKLNFSSLRKDNLGTLYKSYLEAITECRTIQVTGVLDVKNTNVELNGETLSQIESLQYEIQVLSSRIKKQNQLNKKVELNIVIQEKRQQIEELKKQLHT